MIAEISYGMVQSAIFSPLFFNIYIQGVIKEWQEKAGAFLLIACG